MAEDPQIIGEDQLKTIPVFIPDSTILSVGEGGTGANAEGVPADHQRYIYFAKMWNLGAATIASIYESLAGVLQLKDQQLLTQNQTQQIPSAGPSDLPVYRFRSSSFVRIQLSGVGGVTASGVGVTLEFLDRPGGA